MKRTLKNPEVCEHCEGSGFVLSDAGAALCQCQRDTEFARLCHFARIPRKFLGKSLKAFETGGKREKKAVLDESQRFVKAFCGRCRTETCKGLLLFGKEGTGKTHVAVAVLKEVIGHGFTGLYWNVPELFIELRGIMANASEETESGLLDGAVRADLLVLDDLGAERTSDYVTECLYVLINGRYQHDRVTIFTTNRTVDELRGQLGPRIASRICEMCTLVRFPDGDFRREKLL